MSDNYIKRCPSSSFIRKVTMNITMRHHCTSIGKAKIQRDDNMI